MGASRLLVRFTLRTKPFWPSLPEEMVTCLVWGSLERALLISTPPGGEALRLDMMVSEEEPESGLAAKIQAELGSAWLCFMHALVHLPRVCLLYSLYTNK